MSRREEIVSRAAQEAVDCACCTRPLPPGFRTAFRTAAYTYKCEGCRMYCRAPLPCSLKNTLIPIRAWV
jgi:hypothetical protein